MQNSLNSKSAVSAFVVWLALAPGQITLAATTHGQSPIRQVDTPQALAVRLGRIPETNTYPPDFSETLVSAASVSMIEMTTAPGCLPCADLWQTLNRFAARYHWQIRTISGQDALIRSGRLGLPWVGHPVAWVRPLNDPARAIPIAIGTDHLSNVARNAYLATKMLSGVRPSVALRGMARYTGIVAPGRSGPAGSRR